MEPGCPDCRNNDFLDAEEPMEQIKYKILRDRERRPTVTICTISANGSIGTGIAIRSLKDNPVERIGKVKAHGRAKKALHRLSHSMPIHRSEALASLSSVDPIGWPVYKSSYSEG